MTTKALKKQLMAAIAMVVVAAIALTSATYAWFISNTKVEATSAKMTASTAYTLLISEGAKASDGTSNWGSVHEWLDGKTAKALSPVSTIGTLNASNTLDFVFDTGWKAATADATDVTKGGNYAGTFSDADAAKYIKESFEIKAAQNCQIVLDKNTSITGTPGELDKVLRLALVIDDGTTQTVRIYQVDSTSGTATPVNTTLDSADKTADGIGTAIKKEGTVADIDTNVKKLNLSTDVNTGDGASTIMTNQTGESVLYTFTDIANTDTISVTAYIWMEGCDYDCNALETQNFNNTDGTALPVTASLGFSAALPS
ncbi:MAG: hypothetical protein PHS82_16260 [Lachnospiraceae bacterium]|nr:hypothetical protein [Lachnospiraceae bacterium]